jgi:hypothetical protein
VRRAATPGLAGDGQAVRLRTTTGCSLAIGAYPRFRYDARGGGGDGHLAPPDGEGRRPLRFDTDTLHIPPMDGRSARFLGLPLPPGLSIAILPELLQGWLDPARGRLQLRFQARFQFSAAGLYRPPPLWVDTQLSSAAAPGPAHPHWGELHGHALQPDGTVTLVGVAPVLPSGDPWFDRFLGLPSEALAVMRCELQV